MAALLLTVNTHAAESTRITTVKNSNTAVTNAARQILKISEKDILSPTEDIINAKFVDEKLMKEDLLQMLANFTVYVKNDFQECASPNSINELCGCFKGENTMGNDERGVRPNADLSMVCAFLAKYGKDKVTLPAGVTWNDIESMAKKSLVFAYSTHKANRLKVCSGGNYWGSVSNADHVWESSLWAMSVAYSAFFQWDTLSETQKGYIKNMLKAECNYELERNIPTGYNGDTKAEENGWEADILAATLGMFPDDDLAPKWFARLREFAINSYSQINDASDKTVIDPEYDKTTIADLYKGKNLYDDYTLQNHNLFHTSYQNVVMQELGEAALALKMFQQGLHGTEKWKTNALMHNNDKVMKEVLNWLALPDGELAMPNGNDWSLFLYDQITSYSTNACFLKDPDALMLENLAYKYIKARQSTTKDGSWLLRPDVGARRMGVEAHRVMMTWLMHEIMPTDHITPTAWDDFNKRYASAKLFGSQNIVRASTNDRFTCFSWSTGLSNYTGYFAPNSVDKNKILVPYREKNTGNYLGYYTVSGKNNNATPVVSGIYNLHGNSYIMNGELNTNDGILNNRFALYSTPGNAIIYLDYVRANNNGTINQEQGGLLAISVDELTKTTRTLYSNEDIKQLDGAVLTKFNTSWINIDNVIGVVAHNNKRMAFGHRANNNSINTAKLYAAYNDQARSFAKDEIIDQRNITYYSNVSAETTKQLDALVQPLTNKIEKGWNGVIAADPDGTNYLLLANFASEKKCILSDITCTEGAPVFTELTVIDKNKSTATFTAEVNHSIGNTLKMFVKATDIEAIQDTNDSTTIYLRNKLSAKNSVIINAVASKAIVSKSVDIAGKSTVKATIKDNSIIIDTNIDFPQSQTASLTEGYENITSILKNANFEEDLTYSNDKGSVTIGGINYNPCYINNIEPINNKWPNILPVKGWTDANNLKGGSKFCRMYSMPYSTTMYCASPANVGNYTAQCARPVSDETCGDRVLTVLNSWDSGNNAIKQTITLQPGKYRMLLDMKYECTNQQSNTGNIITTPNNTNTSLTGIKVDDVTDYRYPTENATWQTMCYDFTINKEQNVEISLGFNTQNSQGAANNTLLYIDNIRLLRHSDTPDAIQDAFAQTQEKVIYNIQGQKLNMMQKGVNIVNGKKILKYEK